MTHETDPRLVRPAGIRTLRLGDLTVSYLPDGYVHLKPLAWLPASTPEFWVARPGYLDGTGNLVASIGGLLVEHGGRALLIDAGFGPYPVPDDPANPQGAIHSGALLDSFAAHGREPGDVEAVAITHLGIDHVGWLWQAGPGLDRLPFAGARVLVAEPEWAHPDLAAGQGTGRDVLDAFAAQVETVADGQEIFPGVRVRLMPGHSVGHTAYVLSSGGQRLIAFGDALHSPVQVGHPHLSAAPDHDPRASTAVRRALVEELAAPDTVGFGNHFGDVQFGRVVRDAGEPRWQPV
jgi:glyoxylase-like metal-dependent hydrolase (beta-lactamase superfamily II)